MSTSAAFAEVATAARTADVLRRRPASAAAHLAATPGDQQATAWRRTITAATHGLAAIDKHLPEED